jgi:hypothetical protein
MSTDTIIGIIAGTVCGLGLIGGIGILVLGTIFKTRFGVNLSGAKCGKCGKKAPTVRAPQTTYETLWGGWTCEKCGRHNDKWGNKV